MDDDYWKEQSNEHFAELKKEATSLAKWGVRLMLFDLAIVAIALFKPGKWFYSCIEFTIPLIVGLGFIAFFFAVGYAYSAYKQIKGTSKEIFQDKDASEDILYRCLIFVAAFIITLCIVIFFDLSLSPDPWIETEWF